MTTSLNSTVAARDYVSAQLVHYLRKAINVASSATGSTTTVGVLPAGAMVLGGLSGVFVTQDLTGTTNVANIGFAADALSSANTGAYATALALPITTGGFTAIDELGVATGRPRSVDTRVTVTWTGTATTGTFDVVIAYAPNR